MSGLISHLPCQAVRLAPVVAQVAHLAADDVHAGLTHLVFRHSVAGLIVLQNLRDDADVRTTFTRVARVVYFLAVLVPREYLEITDDNERTAWAAYVGFRGMDGNERCFVGRGVSLFFFSRWGSHRAP